MRYGSCRIFSQLSHYTELKQAKYEPQNNTKLSHPLMTVRIKVKALLILTIRKIDNLIAGKWEAKKYWKQLNVYLLT